MPRSVHRSFVLLAALLTLCFALQAATFGKGHAFHSHRVAHASEKAPAKSAIPDECRCDLCLAWHGLDTASVIFPQVVGLVETAFSVVAAYASYDYETPTLHAHPRGPPSLA